MMYFKPMQKVLTLSFLLLSAKATWSQELIKAKEAAHEGGVNCLTLSADGSVLISGGNDMKTYVWNPKTFEKQKGAVKHNDKVNAVSGSQNTRLYLSASADFKARIVDLNTGMPIRVLSEHTQALVGACFLPFTDYIVTTSADNSLKFWDNTKAKTSLATIPLTGPVALAASPDQKSVAVLTADHTLTFYQPNNQSLIKKLEGLKDAQWLCYSPDGQKLAVASKTGKVWIVDLNSLLVSQEFQFGNALFALAYSGDGKVLAVGGEKKVGLFLAGQTKPEQSLEVHTGNVTALCFHPNGDFLVTAGSDGAIKTWKLTGITLGKKVFPVTESPASISLSAVQLEDENQNGILEGDEKATLSFTVRNTGKVAAYQVLAKLGLDPNVEAIQFEKETWVGNLEAGGSRTFKVSLNLGNQLEAGNSQFQLSVQDGNGALASSKLPFQTGGAGSYSYIMVTGQSYTSATGKAEIGAPITLKLKIKNISKGDAKNIKVNYLLPEHVLAVNKLFDLVQTMGAGEEKELSMEFYADKRFALPEIKMGLDVEGAAFTNAKDLILKVKMNEKLGSEDYTSEVMAQASELEKQSNEPVYRGGGDPLKGLNVSTKPKQMVIGNYYALIIGIDKYKGNWPALVNASNDAKAVEKLLKSSYKFEQFKTLYNEQATRQNIITSLEWLVANAKENDNVFIYYSGHGEYKKELNKGFWVPCDAENPSTANYISNSDIQTYISGIKAKHTFLVSDACFSGDIFRGNTISVPFEESEKYYKEVHALPSRQALTSGGLEPVMDGGKDGHSVFAYYFLKTLENNQNKYFDASQLYTKVKIPVINNSEQTPKFSPIKNSGDEGGQFIFIRK